MSISDALRLGATELKAVYNRNLAWALGISVGFHLVLIFVYIFTLNLGRGGSGKSAPIAKMKLTNVTPPASEAPPPPPPTVVPPKFQTGGTGGVAARAGTPVAVPDALLSPDVKDFATTEQVTVSTPEGGDGTGFAKDDGLNKPIDVNQPLEHVEKEKLPDADDFVAVEKEPVYSEEELLRRLQYPAVARNAGIEGMVVVRALVDKRGVVVKMQIDRSDNKTLEEAARDAVEKTTFTPAIQNGQPVATWIQIPVNFKLN